MKRPSPGEPDAVRRLARAAASRAPTEALRRSLALLLLLVGVADRCWLMTSLLERIGTPRWEEQLWES